MRDVEEGRSMKGGEVFRFNEAKATELAARILRKSGRRMEYVRLLKLMYLVDRMALDRHHRPVTGDRVVAMKHGPVLSNALRLCREERTGHEWSSVVRRREHPDYEVELVEPHWAPAGELSRAEVEILEAVMDAHQHRGTLELVDWLHEHCPEWSDPNAAGQKSAPLPHADILAALGKPRETIAAILADASERRELDELFAG